MKKLLTACSVALLIMLSVQSCRKHHDRETETTTVPAVIKANTTYTYTLPVNKEPYRIETQPVHGSASQLSVNAAGETVYTYTPAKDYAGVDQAVVTNESTDRKGRGRCGDDGGRGRRFVFNISVVNAE